MVLNKLSQSLKIFMLINVCVLNVYPSLFLNLNPLNPYHPQNPIHMDKRTKEFLKIISQIESSGGKNINHPVINRGVNAGDRALGQYGLVPNTLQEIGNRLTRLGKADQDTAPLATLPKEQIPQYMQQNPNVEQKAADFLARNLLARMNGNEEFAAKAWHDGSNLKPDQMDVEQLKNDPYTQKYKKIKQDALNKIIQPLKTNQ